MNRTIAITLLLLVVPITGFSDRLITVCPLQELALRVSLRNREELIPLAAEYQQFTTARLQTLKSDQVTNVFGPKLETLRKLNPHLPTNNVALPLFAPDTVSLSGLLVTNDQSHADLYAVGDIAYVEFIYHWDGDIKTARKVLYFRPDATFVPLKTEDDFPRRLEWEKTKWLALQKWLDAHLPKSAKQNELQK